jgi:signal transduction histidine kinase
VFGSLAILALYRDWRVFVPATAVIGIDHVVRGLFWPESVFGVLVPAPWRALEHAGWVLFEDVFLIWNCITVVNEMKESAIAQAELEDARLAIEEKVEQRTQELQQRTVELEKVMNKSRTLELQLLQAQKLESIGQLAAGIAHEINTPMQFVYDNIEFLSDCSDKLFAVVETYQQNLNATGPQKSWQERSSEVNRVIQETRFDHIRREVPNAIRESLEGIQRVINIVRAMKEFSHPGQEERVGVDLNNAVCSTMTITRNRWKYAAELELDLDPDLPPLRCVPAEINQVLLNLIVNAADAIVEKIGDNTGRKGVITVRTRRDRDQIVIVVADTGCGIPDEIRNRIFDPFFTTKEVGKGTGQGLAICYNVVVNKHHGRLDVESTPGVGTRFTVSLPLTKDDENGSDEQAEIDEHSAEPLMLAHAE